MKHQRKLRNYLLDKRFQLKYTGIVIGVTAVLGAVLGYFVHREILVSQKTILARNLATNTYVIEPGDAAKRQEVANRIDDDFTEALRTKVAVVVQVNNAPAGSTAATSADFYQELFEQEVTRSTIALISALVVFLVLLALLWVYLTHRIAGPMYKMKLLFSRVEGDNLRVEGRLRHSDELQDVFAAFRGMIGRLRDDREQHAKRLAAIETLIREGNDPDQAVAELRDLRQGLLDSLSEEAAELKAESGPTSSA